MSDWEALDWVLSVINGIDVSECATPDEAKRHIYGELISTRPRRIEMKMPTCEVCGEREAIGVACVPGVPYSAAYCEPCLECGAHPLNIVVALVVMLGGLENAHEGVGWMVEDTCLARGIALPDFHAMVAKTIKDEEEYWARTER